MPQDAASATSMIEGLSSFTFRKRNIYTLSISNSPFSQVVTCTQIMKFCQLQSLILSRVGIDHDAVVILQQLIAPGSGLMSLTIEIFSTKYSYH